MPNKIIKCDVGLYISYPVLSKTAKPNKHIHKFTVSHSASDPSDQWPFGPQSLLVVRDASQRQRPCWAWGVNNTDHTLWLGSTGFVLWPFKPQTVALHRLQTLHLMACLTFTTKIVSILYRKSKWKKVITKHHWRHDSTNFWKMYY